MTKKRDVDADEIVYVRLSPALAKKLDLRVKRERKSRGEDVPCGNISRSSVIRSAVARMLEQDGGT